MKTDAIHGNDEEVSQCTLLGLDTNSPYLAAFETEQVGQKAFYYLRWVNIKGQPGPWSDLASAVIG